MKGLTPEEVLELIEMHGRTILVASECDDCGGLIKPLMLEKLERMLQLIEMLPDDEHPQDRHEGTVIPLKPKGSLQ